MSSRAFIIWTLAALFVLLMVFGRSPMDDVRKKRMERQGKKLVEKIEDANKKKGGLGGMLGGGGGGGVQGGRTPGTVDWEAEKKAAAGNPAAAIDNSVPSRGANGTTYNSNPNPFMSANPYVREMPRNDVGGQPGTGPRPQGNQNNNNNKGYYPPPPLKKGVQSQFGPQSSLTPEELKKAEVAVAFTRKKNSEHAHPNFVTDDGQSIAYFGTKVYTFANDGSPKPMPDGKYPMYNGRWVMFVRNGEQTVANSGSSFWRH